MTGRIEVIAAHEVTLGPDEGLPVRRTLPTRARTLIGAWCFIDHYGPQAEGAVLGMRVAPHPHTGLQTASWLFSGAVVHRDSAGHHATVRPGELNLMTAGRGISHSEVSVPGEQALHGVQLWIALPDAARFMAPGFEHYAPPLVHAPGVSARVFLGSLLGSSSPVATHTPLVGAELVLEAGTRLHLEVDPAFEHGVLVDAGAVVLDGEQVPVSSLACVAPGATRLDLRATEQSRILLIGGVPLGEQIVMWWNLIGRSHEEIVQFREQWQAENLGGSTDAADHPVFGWPIGEAQAP
ncbi:MAG: pirin family protein, partial [Candidatus Nanopelagicales bacterium]|nr:pirin family protein [Candidatus Nanopelagicales bacterium]